MIHSLDPKNLQHQEESQHKLWTWGDNAVSVWVYQMEQMYRSDGKWGSWGRLCTPGDGEWWRTERHGVLQSMKGVTKSQTQLSDYTATRCMCGVRGPSWKSPYLSLNFAMNLVCSRKLTQKRNWRTWIKSWKLPALSLGLKQRLLEKEIPKRN